MVRHGKPAWVVRSGTRKKKGTTQTKRKGKEGNFGAIICLEAYYARVKKDEKNRIKWGLSLVTKKRKRNFKKIEPNKDEKKIKRIGVTGGG